jgi:putative FmdB family regulatory protein
MLSAMPLYEYRCSKCEKKIEVIRKFSDPPLTEHEGCGGALEQLLSAPAFQDVTTPSSVLPMIASSEESTIAARRARSSS